VGGVAPADGRLHRRPSDGSAGRGHRERRRRLACRRTAGSQWRSPARAERLGKALNPSRASPCLPISMNGGARRGSRKPIEREVRRSAGLRRLLGGVGSRRNTMRKMVDGSAKRSLYDQPQALNSTPLESISWCGSSRGAPRRLTSGERASKLEERCAFANRRRSSVF
jgi:hypothetical protein